MNIQLADERFIVKLATFILILFCIHYIPLETRNGIGVVKLGAMAVCLALFLIRIPQVTKALVIGLVYFFYMALTASFHPETFRASTILFRAAFIFTFVAFYSFVHVERCFTIDSFLDVITKLIYAYVIVLLLQQVAILVGMRIFPLINLCQFLDRGLGGNSLTYEPSTFGRMMGVLYYAYLKCNEYKTGEKLSLKEIFSERHKWVTIGVLYSILTMGSGTAFIVLAVVSLYFLKGWNMLLAIPIFVSVYFILDFMEVSQFERARLVMQATASQDGDMVMEADGSAATRIKPMLNTLTHLNLSEKESWFGAGIDSTKGISIYSDKIMIGEINDYGLVAYFLGLILVFSCSIRFFSIPTIMFFAGIGGGTGNIAYGWGILMVFLCVRYFHDQYKNMGE